MCAGDAAPRRKTPNDLGACFEVNNEEQLLSVCPSRFSSAEKKKPNWEKFDGVCAACMILEVDFLANKAANGWTAADVGFQALIGAPSADANRAARRILQFLVAYMHSWNQMHHVLGGMYFPSCLECVKAELPKNLPHNSPRCLWLADFSHFSHQAPRPRSRFRTLCSSAFPSKVDETCWHLGWTGLRRVLNHAGKVYFVRTLKRRKNLAILKCAWWGKYLLQMQFWWFDLIFLKVFAGLN
jgi:hypothetical protein